ncbi:uncharacterized protein LOC111997374 isoform X1 [Quercus suber]|uniref:uncharacterized protein LOC111997374 isoform X1 n=1 Tax=Quercus suber TaxID=58331 RepID=UPI0032DFCF57
MMFLRQAAANLVRRIRFSASPTAMSSTPIRNVFPIPSLSRKMKFSYKFGSGDYTWSTNQMNHHLWIVICGNAAIILGINANPVFAKDISTESSFESSAEGDGIVGLRKVEDGSVISNIHTSKWRIFTDNGRDFFLRGKIGEAEKFFLSAIQEAREGFGERDPHVASACNNLAELYRVTKTFHKAEPLYLEATNILEESFGPEDIRVGAALHNLGQLYLVQRKLEEAQVCYERALKIEGRVLGYGHTDYSDTMYHLGMVLYLQGKEKDSEALIQDSIRILEEGGQGESSVCIKRLRYLAQDLKTGQIIGGGHEVGGLYYLDRCGSSHLVASHLSISPLQHHCRLVHPSLKNLKSLVLLCRQIESLQCEACQLGKHHRVPFASRRESRVSSPFHLVHFDIWGSINTPLLLGFRYFVIFVDDYSRVTYLYLMKERSKLYSIFKSFYMEIKTQFKASLRIFRSDNAREYFHTSLSQFFDDHGIIHQSSCPYTPQQSGVAKRKMRHLLDVTCALKFHVCSQIILE